MDASLLAFLLVAGAAAALAVFIYRQRELKVRGRGVLAALRTVVFVLALLLIWNPQLPGDLAPQSAAEEWVLLDRSMSMEADGATWQEALDRTAGLAGSGVRIATFGSQVQVVPTGALSDLAATDAATHLASAVERAAEAGARSITVVSDLRVRDGSAASAVLARTPAQVSFEVVGGRLRNAGLAQVVAPRNVESGQTVNLSLTVQGEGGASEDSVTIEVRDGDRLVASSRLPLPGDGRQLSTQISLPAPAAEGLVRYTASVRLPGDVFPADDERVVRVAVGPEIRGAVLVSLSPTWEPRFLLPVLQQVTGLSARGYLRLNDGRYLVAGGGTDERSAVPEDVVQQAVASAELLVLHGVGDGAPDWITRAGEAAGRLLVFAHDPQGAALGGVEVGNPLPGEWYPAPQLLASPLAADLSGTDLTGVPPLFEVLPILGDGPPPPMGLLRDGRGRQESALALGQVNGRRRAVMLANGFWRWGFREGTPRDAYRRLWAAVSGWLLANQTVAAGPGVRPTSPILPRGEPVDWLAVGLAGVTVTLRITAAGTPVLDTLIVVPAEERFTTAALAPGQYDYQATSPTSPEPAGSGDFDVESFTDELLLLPLSLDAMVGAGQSTVAAATPIGRPLRTHPAPYLILLTLLCVEWIARRRLGLR